jgi:hypothetical protein
MSSNNKVACRPSKLGRRERTSKQAIRFEQESWLPQLEIFLAEDRMLPEDVEFSFGSSVRQDINTHPNDMVADLTRAGIKREVKRLRRILGYRQGADDKRAKTRERVRKFRARQSPNPASRRI